jgi:hypothetical protein
MPSIVCVHGKLGPWIVCQSGRADSTGIEVIVFICCGNGLDVTVYDGVGCGLL